MARTPKKKEMDLSTAISEMANRYGFKNITVGFAPHQEFKIVWARCGKNIDFMVSDYLSSAPTDVVVGLIQKSLERMMGETDEVSFGPEITDYLTSEEFLRKNQPTYIERMYAEPDDGRLQESYDRLLEKGYIKDDPNARLYWSDELNDRMSRGSALMHCVKVNDRLKDRDEFDDECLDYAVMKGLSVSQMGFDPAHNPQNIRRFMRKMHNSEIIEDRLNGKGLYNCKQRRFK